MYKDKKRKGPRNIIKENPFITSDAALGKDFYGREKEISQIMEFLEKRKENNLLIHGQRRIGKTSLLLKIKEKVEASRVGKAVFFDLQNKARLDISEVLFELAVQIRSVTGADIDLKQSNFFGHNSNSFFKDLFLPELFEKLPKIRQLILLFDEFDSLGELEGVKGTLKITNIAYHMFIPLLADIKKKEFPLKFIFAVGRNYKDLDENHYGQITKAGSQIEISYFNKEELNSLLKSSDDFLPFETDSIDRLYELTSGHPFFSQCMASSAFDEAIKSEQKSVTPGIIDKQLETAIKRYGGGVLWFWRGFPPNDRIILYLTALVKENNKTISEKAINEEASRLNFAPAIHELERVLERLINIKVLKKAKGKKLHYDFYVEFFRKWIVIENTVEKIGKLLSKINPEIENYLMNGKYYYKQKDYTTAQDYFLKVVDKFPSHYEAILYLGQIAANLIDEDKGYIEKALKWFSKAYKLDPYGTKDGYKYALNQKLTWLEEKGEDTENILKEIQRINTDDSRITEKLKEKENIDKLRKMIEKNTGGKLKLKLLPFLPNKAIWKGPNGYFRDGEGNIIGFNLSNAGIRDIPFLGDFTKLTHLYLLGNKISDLSPLKTLTNLTELSLSNNVIEDISPLKSLTNLRILWLTNNQISDISPLLPLKKLKRLGLRFNNLSQLSKEWIVREMEIKWRDFMDGSEGLFLEGNPLEYPPADIVKKGKEAMKAWFESLVGEKRALNEVKVLLVGDGGSGKTSLVKRLLKQGFDENEPQTHGININHWEVKLKKNKIKVNIWDFGGQEIMHSTHQFFLSERSLYILVLDGRKDEKVEYWIKHVKSFGGDSPVLVVINKIDENPGFDVNRLFLQEKYPHIKGFFRVSCLKDKGIQTFSQNLARELAKVELISTLLGESWFKIKTQLEQMKKEKKNYISYDDYNALCHKEKIYDNSVQDTLVRFLNDLGVVIHFKDFKLKETYVLEPEWVTTAVYKVINSREISETMGLLKLNRLDEILKQKTPEDHYYPPDKYRFIIELMQKFELCYEIDRETTLIPDLLEVQQPVFDFDYKGALKFQVDYDFLPRSIMPRFIVKMHQDIKEGLHWRTGMVLEDKAFDCTAVVKSDDEAGKIYIYVQGDQKRYYFAVIRHNIRAINRSIEKLEVSERVPVPDDPAITVSYDHLIELNEMGEKYLIPEGAKKRYDIANLLDGFEETKASPIALNINKRRRILDDLDALIFNPNTKESEIHKILQDNLWILGVEYSKVSSNETLKKVVEQYLGKKYKGESAKNRPDLLLTQDLGERYLLIELKKPDHAMDRKDEAQGLEYRDELNIYLPNVKIEIIIMGGQIKKTISTQNLRGDVKYFSYNTVISNARNNLKWLIEDLDRNLDHTQK